MIVIRIIESGFETTEEGGHGQVHAAMSEVDCRVDEDGLAMLVTEEIAAPKIAVKKRGGFLGEDSRQSGIEALELAEGGGR